jgi:hypothetical protein
VVRRHGVSPALQLGARADRGAARRCGYPCPSRRAVEEAGDLACPRGADGAAVRAAPRDAPSRRGGRVDRRLEPGCRSELPGGEVPRVGRDETEADVARAAERCRVSGTRRSAVGSTIWSGRSGANRTGCGWRRKRPRRWCGTGCGRWGGAQTRSIDSCSFRPVGAPPRAARGNMRESRARARSRRPRRQGNRVRGDTGRPAGGLGVGGPTLKVWDLETGVRWPRW